MVSQPCVKLSIELVPQTCWFSNVRSQVTKKQWDLIRSQVYSAAYDTCEICGGVGDKHPVEAHEVWHYNDKKLIQTLERMIALCPACHSVKHIGLAFVQGRGEASIKHLMKINKFSKNEATTYINEAMKIWEERSQFEWALDINILDQYGIDVSKLKKRN